MSTIFKNVLANFGGQACAAILNVILIPFYIKTLGIEAYGLIGFFVSLQAIVFILDFGLGATTVREIANRANADRIQQKEIPRIVRTLEVTYIGIGCIVAFLILFLSNFIASQWINSEKIPVETIRFSIIIFGIIMAFRWPNALYTGVLNGLEFQIIINIISFIMMLFKSIGIIIILVLISNTIHAFFIWQLIISIIELILNYFIAWNKIPQQEENIKLFDLNILKSLWQFSYKVSLISICAAVLKQLDKILIVKLFPLQQAGYYYTAAALISGIYMFSSPITIAVLPRFSSLYGQNKISELTETYHLSARLLSLLVACFSGAMIYFSYDILLLWTHSKEIADNAYPILTVLSLAALFNNMMQIPYMVQLATGLIWLPLWNNVIAVIVLAPTIYILVYSIGIIGGAISWLIYNFFYFNIVPRIMHRYILINQFNKWFYKDTLQFMIIGNLIFGTGFLIKYYLSFNLLFTLAIMIVCFVIYMTICLYFNKDLKRLIPVNILNRINQL